ncbi:abscisic acid receptor PYL3-like [Eucalyptus grandis]|uniref:abscisic acid receptor PYL3-like n=1 Tax=Eucalyptus grandis TaxID=71139 RepID=UPI00192EF789|nr:abscisic acid receptor PYL3-like [Eucalyptus grandis]
MDPGDKISSQYRLSPQDSDRLKSIIQTHHTLGAVAPNTCTSLIAWSIDAPAHAVWPLALDFTNPRRYKPFIRKCHMREGNGGVGVRVWSRRDIEMLSGPPASTSMERVEILDDERRVVSFRIIGGDHGLCDYRSVTSVNEIIEGERKVATLVLESYAVQIPEGKTCEDTKVFVNTILKQNQEIVMASLKKEKNEGGNA